MRVTIQGQMRDPCGDGNVYLDLIYVSILTVILHYGCARYSHWGTQVKSTENLSILLLTTACKFTTTSKESLIFKNVIREEGKERLERDINVGNN